MIEFARLHISYEDQYHEYYSMISVCKHNYPEESYSI